MPAIQNGYKEILAVRRAIVQSFSTSVSRGSTHFGGRPLVGQAKALVVAHYVHDVACENLLGPYGCIFLGPC